MSRIDPRIHIGEQYGVYVIEDVLPEDQKDKYGHWTYKAVCKECGFEKIDTYGRIKYKPPNRCTHIHEYKIKNCLYCGKEIPINNTPASEYNRKIFCNNSCSASYTNRQTKKKHKTCLNCGIEIKSQNKYCSNKCQQEFLQKEWEEKWFAGEVSGNINPIWTSYSNRVKTYLFRIHDSKCAKCGWGEINPYTGTIPLEVEHIDGDPFNTTPDNVTILCPNCHSLTATYRGANRGNGRGITWLPKPIEIEI